MGATPPRPPRRKTEAERAKDIFEARTAPSPGPEPSRDNGPDLITWAGVGHLLGDLVSLKDAAPKVELVQSVLTWATDNIAPQPWCPKWLRKFLGVGRTFGAWDQKPGEEWKGPRE